MRTHNHNQTLTHLAMPERQIPVLINAGPKEAEGFVPSIAWSDKRQTGVRRLLPSFVDGLRNPSRHREIEQGYGATRVSACSDELLSSFRHRWGIAIPLQVKTRQLG